MKKRRRSVITMGFLFLLLMPLHGKVILASSDTEEIYHSKELTENSLINELTTENTEVFTQNSDEESIQEETVHGSTASSELNEEKETTDSSNVEESMKQTETDENAFVESTDVHEESSTSETIESSEESSAVETVEPSEEATGEDATTESSQTMETEETTETQPILQQKEGREVTAEGWRLIDTPKELSDALKESPQPDKIRLNPGGIFDMKGISAAVKSDLEIDGNGRVISYSDFSLSRGIHAEASDITVKMSNMVFGSPDFSVPMNNLYGLFPAAFGENVQLYLENVRYYSNRGAQAFHLNSEESAIYFSGTNEFNLEGSGEEFAQADKFHFLPDSQTTIRHTTSSNNAFIWSYYSGLTEFDVKENALVDVETNHCFFYNQNNSKNGALTLADGAQVKIRSVNARSAASKDFLLEDGHWNILVGKQAILDIEYPNSIKLGDGSQVTAGSQSSMRFSVTEAESIFDRNVGASSKLTIDNANLVEFSAQAGNEYNPIGFSGGTNQLKFAPFADPTEGYSIQTDQPQEINHQKDAGTWNITTKEISRSPATNTEDFTPEEKSALLAASTIRIVKIPAPVATIQSLKKDIGATVAGVKLDNYQLNGNALAKVRYRLFTQAVNHPEEDEHLVEETEILPANLSSYAEFTNLTEDTDYWIYVKIDCTLSGQSSEWYSEKIHTQAMMNIEFPMYISFQTVNGASGQEVIPLREYSIKNKSSFAVDVSVDSFSIEQSGNISLLSDENGDEDGLFLQLDDKENEAVTLFGGMPSTSFSKIPSNSIKNIGLDGFYRGSLEEATDVNYILTMSAKKVEEP